jgi:uncharacterized protein YegL
MNGREKEVVGGLNALIADQKKLKEPCSMSFVRFDTSGIERFRDMTPIQDVLEITQDEFVPRGGTPLLDAIGKTIVAVKEDFKKEKAAKAIIVIVTDGEENESKEYTKNQIKQMVEDCEKNNIAFMYLGANVDAFAEAHQFGIRAVNTAGYIPTSQGICAMYSNVSDNMTYMRNTMFSTACSMNVNFTEQLSEKV